MRRLAFLFFLGAGCAHPKAGASALQVTLGELETPQGVCAARPEADCSGLDRASLVPKMRAEVEGGAGDEAELAFAYLGPTEEIAPLASGEARRQLGLKLRARDSCNVLYVMWRLAPRPGLVVQRKSNPDQSRYAECGTSGYRTLRPTRKGALPTLEVGARHRLRARIEGETLRVWVDEALVWEGRLDEAAAALDGPIGVRSDNVRFVFKLSSP